MIDLPLARAAMADRLAAIGFPDGVIAAMRAVPRHAFVPRDFWRIAYAETGLWLGACWLPAPSAVARAAAALAIAPGQRALEIGTGSGYQAALLAAMGALVFTVETAGGYDLSQGALARHGDPGIARSLGGDLDAFADAAPFDAIVANIPFAALPAALAAQLAPGGRIVAPLAIAGAARLALWRADPSGVLRPRDLGPHAAVQPAAAAFAAIPGAGTEP
ncbi:MAG: protein-L-isoaspartate O-methyltransferase [Proteobacteria bacterium]|nr:protein-L-isoaspartate O-methyltransferase [Pseudomonadota bacterium]